MTACAAGQSAIRRKANSISVGANPRPARRTAKRMPERPTSRSSCDGKNTAWQGSAPAFEASDPVFFPPTRLRRARLLPAKRNRTMTMLKVQQPDTHAMTMLKIQTWRPDTHPGHIVEEEWEYDMEAGRDTGREHRCLSVRYPDGTLIHRDTHGTDVAQEHYK